MKKTWIIVTVCILASCGAKRKGIESTIASYVGKVLVNGAMVASPGVAIKYGDLIETGDNSYCDIIMNEKNILRMNENSRMTFKISEKESYIELTRGWLAGVTTKIFSNEGTYLIKTPTTVASVRGTSFCTKVENPDSTYFCVCNGNIELIKPGRSVGDLIEAPHHIARRYKKEKDGTISIDKNPGLLYHNDTSIETLAKKINVTIDWTRAD
jgi:ferric-dicitrate binding protein FerR (iron transport regulator)